MTANMDKKAFTLADGASHGAVSDSVRKIAARIIRGAALCRAKQSSELFCERYYDRHLTSSTGAPLPLTNDTQSFVRQSRKFGFTLAEVLITLGIIGVVAALTIPNITAHYRKKVVETRLAKFYSSINQAIRRSEADNGPVKYWDVLTSTEILDENEESTGYVTTNNIEWYNKYLKPYLQVQKVEDTSTFEAKTKVYFPDGSLLLFSSSSWIFYPEAKNYAEGERESTSGSMLKDRNRADSGVKWFTFQLYPNYGNGGVYPYAQISNPTDIEIRTSSSLGCKTEVVSNERAYCTLMIARNGWKIPKDYPLKF